MPRRRTGSAAGRRRRARWSIRSTDRTASDWLSVGGMRRGFADRRYHAGRIPWYGSASSTHRRTPRIRAMSSDPRGPAFPSTRWSRILAAPAARDLDALARDYARPIEAWLGARLRLSADDARELLQEAFAWMLATGFFDRADPARGRFRALLKTALAHFAIEQRRRASAHKRGGDIAHEPLDAALAHADPRQPTPDQVLDDAWRRELLQ